MQDRLMLCDDAGRTAWVSRQVFIAARSAREDVACFFSIEPDCTPWATKYVEDLGQYCPEFPRLDEEICLSPETMARLEEINLS